VSGILKTASVLVKHDVSFVTDIQLSGVDTVVGDPHRLTQIINNIISNAAKFTSSGPIS